MEANINLQQVHHQLALLLQKVTFLEHTVEEIHHDIHPVRPEYLEKLERIKQQKAHHFSTKEEFLHFLHHEI